MGFGNDPLPGTYIKFSKKLKKKITQLTFTCPNSNNRNTIKSCEICSKLTIKTPEQLQ